jgi:Ca2+-binding RTX toxin-like protein
VSTFIQPVTPVSTETATKPEAGTTTPIVSGETVAVTDPNSGADNPTTLEAPATGSFDLSSASEGSNIIVEGPGTAEVNIGTAVDEDDNKLSGSGTAFQIDENYQGSVNANLNGAITGGEKVDGSTETPAGNTIADNLPGEDSNAFATTTDLDFYINTGAANDQVQGSSGNDFIRLGAGDDVFNSAGGDDIVRVGTGNDSGSLGAGDDILYLTVDQLQGENVNTITDFDADGNDKIQIDGDLEGLVDIEGVGTKSILITLSGAQTGSTAVVSEGNTIDDDDIEFV